jgi:nitrogen fixation NifU-like protein
LGGIYGDLVMDHYRNPRNRYIVEDPDIECYDLNPFCGDDVDIKMKLDENGRVKDISIFSNGCSITQASASIMGEEVTGMTVNEIGSLYETFRLSMTGAGANLDGVSAISLRALQTVRQYPVRVKCVMLPWVTIIDGISRTS